MYEDVPSSIMLDKTILNELVNENVIPYTLNQKFKKGSFYCPFFLFVLKICDEQNDEQVMKQNRKLS